ncbi:hypothetical protein ACQPYE_27885 [Actinosynnema sp. CA-299493]
MKIFHSTATALAVFLSVSACSSSTSISPDQSGMPADVDGPLPETSTVAATNPVDEARAQGVQTYRQMWTAYATAGATADWQSPELARYATGGALSTLTRGLFGYRDLKIVTRGQPVLNPVVSSVEPPDLPAKVIVSDCGDSTTWTKHYADSGALADGEPGGRRHINAVVEKQVDGSWKVSDFGVHEVGTC